MGYERHAQKGADICIHIEDSLLCIAETNMTLYGNYTPLKKKITVAVNPLVEIGESLVLIQALPHQLRLWTNCLTFISLRPLSCKMGIVRFTIQWS